MMSLQKICHHINLEHNLMCHRSLRRYNYDKDLEKRSFWLWMGPKWNDECIYKMQTHKGEGHVKMEKEIGVMHLQLKECQGLPAATGHYNSGMDRSIPQSLQQEHAYWHLDFSLLPSRVVREYISAVSSYQVCGSLLHFPVHLSSATKYSSMDVKWC